MTLAHYAESVRRSQKARARIQREGFTPGGHKIWTEDEINLLRRLKQEVATIYKLLPHRSKSSIRCRLVSLGLEGHGTSPHFWTAFEISRLRKLYPAAPAAEICQQFPHSSWANIQQVARYHNLRRTKKAYKITGIPALDAIRLRCYEIGWTMADLDAAARTKSYFYRARWIKKKSVNHKALGRAIEALDGIVFAKWKEYTG